MNEAEWLTRKTRIDARLRSLTPSWEIIPWRDGLEQTRLLCHAVTEFPTANGPADYALFVNGVLLGILEAKKVAVNCLFEGKAGEVFEILMQDCNLHTVLRLPRGTFTPYSQGVKANVIFFQKGRPSEEVWIFDARSNVPGITKKDRPLMAQHFAEFEAAYGKDPNGLSKRRDSSGKGGKSDPDRFRKFHISEIKERGYKLDITWLRDESLEDSDGLPEPQDLASEAVTELEAVVDDLKEIIELIEKEEGVEK